MRCRACQRENPAEAQFCLDCGVRLGLSCSQCGTELPGDARFCLKCGRSVRAPPERTPRSYTPKHLADKILQSKSALEGERKQVTVLFVDVKGSMELAEELDPEEWHRILDRFFQILSDGVHRFEGSVNQYTGDGIMALFGAPIAHEDHAQRACYAALHLRDELRRYAEELRLSQGLNFSVRMGLNSGDVVVGKIGDDLRMDYTAQGHTVGLAARMEQVAEAGRIYLTGSTASLVGGFFRLRDLGATRVKGVDGGVRVHELEEIGQLRTRFDVARRRGLSRFVGRGDEMAALDAALARALDGQGQVVGVVGEAGVGKSRLCFEFAERCRARGIPVLEGHGLPHGKNAPLLPMLEFARASFGIGERDGDQTARDKIAGRMLLLDRSLEEALPLVFDFLGVPDPGRPMLRLDPEVRQRRLIDTFLRLMRARIRREPAVLLIEDLHWLDAASENFLEHLAEGVLGTRTLLLVDYRPEYEAGWTRRSYYEQLPLLPLTAQSVRELLLDLLGPDPSLAGLGDRIYAHTGGNPFFVEESVRALAEAGGLVGAPGAYRLAQPIEELSIPPTVQAVLAARIDRLAEREKRVLQIASVIGKTFSEPALRSVAALPDRDLGEALHRLVGAEFLYEEALYPETVYAFTHPLTQQVAYGSQLADRRRRTHADVARALEELHRNRLDERAALLAHHWEGAGEPLLAARWHQRAAAWAGVNHAAEALRHCRRVRDLLGGVPESSETIALGLEARTQLLVLATRTATSDEEVARLFAEGEALAARSGDPRSQVVLLSAYGASRMYVGAIREAVETLRRARRLADDVSDPGLRASARLFLSVCLFYEGALTESLSIADEVLEIQKTDPHLGEDLTGYDPSALGLAQRGRCLLALGRFAAGAEELRRALDLARRGDDPAALCMVESICFPAAVIAGDETTALAQAHHMVEIAERLGTAYVLGIAYTTLGYAHVLGARFGEAVDALERARARGVGYDRLVSTPELARAYLGVGNVARGRAMAEEAVSLTRRAGARLPEILALLALAQALIEAEGAKERAAVDQALSRASTLIQETGFRGAEPRLNLERARLARALGDEARCERELSEARRLFTEMGATGGAAAQLRDPELRRERGGQ